MSLLFGDGPSIDMDTVRPKSLEPNTHSLMGGTRISGLVEQILFLHRLTLAFDIGKMLYSLPRTLKVRMIGETLCFLAGTLPIYFAWPLLATIVQALAFLYFFSCRLSGDSCFLLFSPLLSV